MPLPASGPISMANIRDEFGDTNPVSLNEFYAGGGKVPAGLAGGSGPIPTTGAISMSKFRGSSLPTLGNLASMSYVTLTNGTHSSSPGVDGNTVKFLRGNGTSTWVYSSDDGGETFSVQGAAKTYASLPCNSAGGLLIHGNGVWVYKPGDQHDLYVSTDGCNTFTKRYTQYAYSYGPKVGSPGNTFAATIRITVESFAFVNDRFLIAFSQVYSQTNRLESYQPAADLYERRGWTLMSFNGVDWTTEFGLSSGFHLAQDLPSLGTVAFFNYSYCPDTGVWIRMRASNVVGEGGAQSSMDFVNWSSSYFALANGVEPAMLGIVNYTEELGFVNVSQATVYTRGTGLSSVWTLASSSSIAAIWSGYTVPGSVVAVVAGNKIVLLPNVATPAAVSSDLGVTWSLLGTSGLSYKSGAASDRCIVGMASSAHYGYIYR